jgi:hypothetical protein
VKFSDVIIASVSLVLFGLILDAILMVAFVPLNNDRMADWLAALISFLAVSLVVGYVFALKIQEESRIRAIGVVVVLAAFIMAMFLSVWIANYYGGIWFRDDLNNSFKPSGWSDYEYAAVSALMISVSTIVTLVISFIGLYAGSMLRRPK